MYYSECCEKCALDGNCGFQKADDVESCSDYIKSEKDDIFNENDRDDDQDEE